MEKPSKEHSLAASIFLHLLPGLLTAVCYFSLVPVVSSWGFPSVMALCLSGMIVLIPFVSFTLFTAKKRMKVPLKNGVIRYLQPLKMKQYLLWIPVVFISSGLLFLAFSFASDALHPLFSWIPDELMLDMGLEGGYSGPSLVITYGVFLVLIVFLLPVTEEIYFRGYLLPRMPVRLKGWAPLVHSGLFALYHLWTPWLFITRTISVLPLAYVVRWKQNIYIGIVAHCLVNSIDFFAGLAFLLKM